MGRRRDSHRRRVHDELSSPQWLDLLTNSDPESDVFDSEEERYEAWLAHRDEYMESHKPGTRPGAWWRFEAPEGAPDREDYRGSYDGRTNTIVPDEDGNLTTDEFELAELRFLASHGLLDDDETAALLRRPGDPGLAPYARESAQRDADAVLDGLTAGQHLEDESAA